MEKRNVPVGMRSSRARRGDTTKGDPDEIVLTPEEEKLLTPEFVRETVSKAMAAVKRLQEQASMDVNEVLAMRDVLFTEWLRRKLRFEPDLGTNATDLEAVLAAVDEPGELQLPENAATTQRVTEFAAEEGLEIGKFLRLLDEMKEDDHEISEETSDSELHHILQTISSESS
jgi:hypothetical protein